VLEQEGAARVVQSEVAIGEAATRRQYPVRLREAGGHFKFGAVPLELDRNRSQCVGCAEQHIDSLRPMQRPSLLCIGLNECDAISFNRGSYGRPSGFLDPGMTPCRQIEVRAFIQYLNKVEPRGVAELELLEVDAKAVLQFV